MNSNRIFISILGFILFLMAQVLLLKNLVLFGSAFCFLYVLYILLLPVDLKIIPTLLIAFVLGLGVDFFYDTWAYTRQVFCSSHLCVNSGFQDLVGNF